MGKIIPDYFVKKEKEGKGEGRKRRNPSPLSDAVGVRSENLIHFVVS